MSLWAVRRAEVTLDDALDFGMDAKYTRKSGDRTETVGTNFQMAAEIQKFNGFSVSITGGDMSFFLRALATQGKLEVLSRPMVLASDNQEAMINVGDEVAFITDSRISENGTTFNTVQYRPVGITLNVTPRINPDGLVKLEINPRVASLSTSSVAISPGVNAPIINTREARTTVSVQDGHTIVLGGLIQTKDENRQEKVPFLGDIPLLGELFKKTNKVRQRKELLIILTPHVVRNVSEADSQTSGKVDRLNRVLQKSNLREVQDQLQNNSAPETQPATRPEPTDVRAIAVPTSRSAETNFIPVELPAK